MLPVDHFEFCLNRSFHISGSYTDVFDLDEKFDREIEAGQVNGNTVAQVDSKNRELKKSITCIVCFDHIVDLVLRECGHTICTFCYNNKVKPLRHCHVCRQQIEKAEPFFFANEEMELNVSNGLSP